MQRVIGTDRSCATQSEWCGDIHKQQYPLGVVAGTAHAGHVSGLDGYPPMAAMVSTVDAVIRRSVQHCHNTGHKPGIITDLDSFAETRKQEQTSVGHNRTTSNK